MKKSITAAIICLAVIALTAYGQISNNKMNSTSDNSKYIYCELWEQNQGNIFSSVTKIFLNFGNNSIYPKQKEENNKVSDQKDVLDALNYMNENGWELAAKNVRELDGGTETCYLLKRKTR